ncbi:hypothetical protein BJV82DRAFT_39642 [Fennellomyces sp. T-0311]|nr:hypothetical protein BJV82DRAFT_39642 [Fennellomyces sp. T-0311]
MARFFNENHEKLFVLAPQTDDDDSNFLLGYRAELDEIFSSFQPLQIEAYTGAIASNDRSQSAGPTEHFYKGVRRIIAGHIQFRSEAQAERAYALFNDTYIIAKSSRKSRVRMEFLYYNIDDLLELPALLVVSGIPAAIQHWFPETFDAFRHFGTMMKCQRRHRCAIHQCSNAPTTGECPESHDPTVVLQYASKEDSDRALAGLV